MKLNLIEIKEILDFEKEIGYELVVDERYISYRSQAGLYKYSVSFDEGDILDGRFIVGCIGNGQTIDEALKDFCTQVSCKTIVFNATSPNNRKEIKLPKLVHTKLLHA